MNQRGAVVTLQQLPNGYWYCAVMAQRADTPIPLTASGDSFHDAGACLDWARTTIDAMVSR